jgi:hypothetical protein
MTRYPCNLFGQPAGTWPFWNNKLPPARLPHARIAARRACRASEALTHQAARHAESGVQTRPARHNN